MAVQYQGGGQALDASSRRLLGQLDLALGTRPDLVVLPETAVSGYLLPRYDAALAVSESPEGGRFGDLSTRARRAGTWIVGGYVEREGDRLYNAARVIDRSGQLVASYRKTLLFDEDLPWATPGTGAYAVYDTGAGRFTVGICMDLNDPRFLRWCRRARADVVAFPTAWMDEGLDMRPYWQARMAGTGSTLVAANAWGRLGHLDLLGCSAIVDEHEVLAGLGPVGDGLIGADLGPRVPALYSTVLR